MTDNVNMGANPEVYQYLVDNYVSENTKIKVLDNGGYYLTGVHSNDSGRTNNNDSGHTNNEIYIPPTIGSGENISIINYFPGGEGVQVDADHWRKKCLSDNPPNAIVTMASYGKQSFHYVDQENDILEIGLKIANDNNSTVTNVAIQTFSESTNSCTEFTNNFVGNHPEINTTLIVTDGSPNRDYVGENLLKYNTPIIMIKNVDPGYNSREMTFSINAFDRIGYNVKVIETSHILKLDAHPEKQDKNYNDHFFANADVTNSGLTEYILGLRNDLDSELMKKCNYKLYYPEDENLIYINDWTDFSSIQQLNFTVKTQLQTMNENPYDYGTVGSDMYTITKLINNVRNNMNSDVLGMPENMSSTTIPNDFSKVQNSLFGISGDLNKALYGETGIIAHIAQVFCDMDTERAEAAQALNNGTESNFNESKYIDILNSLVSVDLSYNITFESFLFKPEEIIIGNSGRLYASDINSMLNGNSLIGALHENLENERIAAKNMKNEIDNMISTISFSSSFSGNVWGPVCDRLSQYGELMNTRIKSADILEIAFVKALTLLKNFMEDYEELDDSKVTELKENANKLKQDIINANNIINATHLVNYTKTNENGEEITYQIRQYMYSAETRRNTFSFLRQAEKTLVQIEKLILKLENLPIVIAQAQQIVNDALVEIYRTYGIQTSRIIVGKEVSYIPPTNTAFIVPTLSSNEHWKYYQNVPENKVSMPEFYSRHDLIQKYGASYKDYLNDVEHLNSSLYNSLYNDNSVNIDFNYESESIINSYNETKSENNDIPPIVIIPDDAGNYVNRPSVYNNVSTNILEIN